MKYSINTETAQWRVVDGEAVVVNMESSYYYGLNRTGTFVWLALSTGARTASELAADIAQTFGIDVSQARADVNNLLQDLSREHLVMES